MKTFDLLQTPLDDGTNLIEASAGTGKTHTIAGLFLRLLLEKDVRGQPVHIDEILVVTYTEAATEELRDRIRRVLVLAAAGFTDGRSDDVLIQALLERHADRRDALRERLTLSLNCFDLAPIYTIHGFCQRALKDRAFESGSLFDAEVLADQTALLQEIADDYWRQNFYEASPLRVAVARKEGLEPARFLRMLRSCLGHAELTFLTRAGAQDAAALAQELEAAFTAARTAWIEDRARIEGCFGQDTGWGKLPYSDEQGMNSKLALLPAAFAMNGPEPGALEALAVFASGAIARGTRKKPKVPAPSHPFCEACERFARRTDDYVIALLRDFVGVARRELRARKEKLKLLSYDDLLTRLRDALRPPDGPALAAELRARYKAALIDEFQDTDPVQCEIFSRIFAPPGNGQAGKRESGKAAEDGAKADSRFPAFPLSHLPSPPSAAASSLFLIGDPKQAIYGFRGADIFTYMDVARKADRGFTLGENWRSESGLVAAVNTLFGQAAAPFVFGEIQFHPVRARGRANDEPLTLGGRIEPPLQLWFCPRDGRPIGKARAERDLARATAAEITRLLNGDTRLGGRPLRPQDIAVLTMTHRQAQQVQTELNALRVPSVQQTQESLFTSDEAGQMLRLLAAIAEPANEPFLRAALATDILGCGGLDLDAAQRDAAARQGRLAQFRGWFDRWLERGFTSMFRQVLDEQRVRARLLAMPEGERALTNVLHLAEVLHQAALQENLGMRGLLQWLAARMDETEVAEEHQLRLERDENAVQLVTVHKSKGLQYEVVFAPFCWRGSELKRRSEPGEEQEVLFHDRRNGGLVRDLGPEHAAANVAQAREEKLAENVRLLYVALTRAKHRCTMAWGAFSGAETSAPAWLLHRGAPAPGSAREDEDRAERELGAPAARWPIDFGELTDEQMRRDLQSRIETSGGGIGPPTIALQDLPVEPGEVYRPKSDDMPLLACREFKGDVPRDWRVTSFSGLAAGQRDEAPDRDATDWSPASTVVESSEAGNATLVPLHEPERPLSPSLSPAPSGGEGARRAGEGISGHIVPARGIFAFPRGSKAGTCLHKIFESLDFTMAGGGALDELTRRELRDHGFPAAAFADGVTAAVRNTLAVPLDSLMEGSARQDEPVQSSTVASSPHPSPPLDGGEGARRAGEEDPHPMESSVFSVRSFRLSQIQNSARLNELEFCFPLRKVAVADLVEVFARHGRAAVQGDFPDQLGRLTFSPARGFINGFIDLVFQFDGRFWLADWKSNWLGNRAEDYGPEALRREMAGRLYVLQYHLYVVALDRWLRLRVPGYDYARDFGGAFYLFLRGIDPARPDLGVFRDRPAPELVNALGAVLLDREIS